MTHAGAVLLIGSSRCSDILLIKSAVDFSNLEYRINFYKCFF